MIGSITRLWHHGEAVAHALLPGEGPQPRLVAGSPELLPLDGGAVQAAELVEALRRPLRNGDYQPTPTDRLVWCCSLRHEEGETPLSDADWAQVARRVITAAGLDAEQDPAGGCPWVAIRTSDQNRLIVLATLMRADGSRPDLHHSAPRVRALLQVLTRSSLPFRAAASQAFAASAAATPAIHSRRR